MKTHSVIPFLFALLFIGCTQSPGLSEVDREEIAADVQLAFEGLVEASRSLQPEPYLNYIDRERFVAVLDGTVLESFGEFEQLYRTQLPFVKQYLSLEFNKVSITVLGRDAALLVNEYQEVVMLAMGDTLAASGGGSQVWARIENEWKLAAITGSSNTTG